jgi:hypothetical protein
MTFLLAVTFSSMLLAAVMSVIAWRIAGAERRRSDARIAALAAAIHDAPWPPTVAPALDRFEHAQERVVGHAPFIPPVPQPRSPLLAVFAAAVVVLGVGATLGMPASPRFRAATQAVQAATASLPLELVALGHERVGDTLTVRGVVRNPMSGTGIDRLNAVVALFTADGGLLTTGRADVEAAVLRPGSESAFTVTIPGVGNAGRYRVSFRSDDHLVPHLDRRHEN